MRYFIDTNIVSAYMKGHDGVIARWHGTPNIDILIPAVVLAEGLTGAIKKTGTRWLTAWRQMAEEYHIIPFDDLSAACYAELRAHLEKRGCMIGIHDCEIAATALAWQATHPADEVVLVTNNLTEFQRIPHLRVEDWSGG